MTLSEIHEINLREELERYISYKKKDEQAIDKEQIFHQFCRYNLKPNNDVEEFKGCDLYLSKEEVVKKEYCKYNSIIKEEVQRYNRLWEKYNDLYFETLSNYLDVEWPKNLDIIEGKVGLLPVFPRDLDGFSFAISIGVDDLKIIETCAHETLHFLWFEKWKNIHPETPRREYDSPYITWQYSEMVTDPILNNDPFADMFNF